MIIFTVALAPILIIAFYIYFRDKYEREPIWMLIKALLGGVIIIFPIIWVETYFTQYQWMFTGIYNAAYNAFVVASFTEEMFKFIILFILVWSNRNFNEKFDGIVYASFVSLGFAAAENLSYVANWGISVGFIRAFTAVPAHTVFGVIMGYHFAFAKFYPEQRAWRFLLALLMPMIFHGIYDFILMSGYNWYLLAFIPFVVYMWIYALRRMKALSDISIFRNKNQNEQV